MEEEQQVDEPIVTAMQSYKTECNNLIRQAAQIGKTVTRLLLALNTISALRDK